MDREFQLEILFRKKIMRGNIISQLITEVLRYVEHLIN